MHFATLFDCFSWMLISPNIVWAVVEMVLRSKIGCFLYHVMSDCQVVGCNFFALSIYVIGGGFIGSPRLALHHGVILNCILFVCY